MLAVYFTVKVEVAPEGGPAHGPDGPEGERRKAAAETALWEALADLPVTDGYELSAVHVEPVVLADVYAAAGMTELEVPS